MALSQTLNKETDIAVEPKESKKPVILTDKVRNRIDEMTAGEGLVLPKSYSAANALKSAWLILQEIKDKNGVPVMDSCSTESIYNALLDMVVQGLNPMKKQCYFVPFGGQLNLMRSYMGTIAAAKRIAGVKDVRAQCIFEGDELEYYINPDTGRYIITKHLQKFENIDVNKITGAYAVVIDENENLSIELMTMAQIRAAWNQGQTNGNSPAHRNFPEEMAKKTVINRACKLFVNTGDDSDLLVDAFNRTTENEFPGFKNGQDVDVIEVSEGGRENQNVEAVKALMFDEENGEGQHVEAAETKQDEGLNIEVVEVEDNPFSLESENPLVTASDEAGD